MISSDDVTLLLFTLIEVVVLAFIVYRLIYFVPDFVLSVVRSIRSRSLIYDSEYVNNPNLISAIDKKTMIDKEDVY